MSEICKRFPGFRTACAGGSLSFFGSLNNSMQNASNQTFG
jgi:hypothetical protein